ncbi:MAG: thioesterase family protein [Bdellovibrionales bacterium]|nr:thioesterase family protein [Bdellovibrionales bacterium]
MKFSRELSCHFDLCDPAGILFYGQAFFICHQTIEEFVQHIGIHWEEWFANPKLSVPVRHAEAEYTLPIHAGDKFKAVLQLNKLGSSSVCFEVNLINSKGESCAKVTNIHVFIDRESGKKTNIPGSFEDRLRRYLSA